MRRSAAVLALSAWVVMGACRPAAVAPAPEPPPAGESTGATAGSATEAPPSVAVRELANLQFDAPLDAIAVDGSGQLAVFVEDGTIVLHQPKADGSGMAEVARGPMGGRAVDAGWIGGELVALDITRDGLARFGPVTEGLGEPVLTELGGDPRDLWIDRGHRRLWALVSADAGSELVVIDLPEFPAAATITQRFAVGASPVSIVPSPDQARLAVASFRGEQVHTFTVEPPAAEQTQTVPFRPALLVWPAVDRVLVAAANLTSAEIIELPSGVHSTVALPAALNVMSRGEGGVYAFSPSQAVLYRLDRSTLAVLGETAALQMATVLDATLAIVAAVDAQELGRVVLLDALTLDTLATWPLTGHPSRIESVNDVLFAMCPNDRRVVVLRVVDGRSAAP